MISCCWLMIKPGWLYRDFILISRVFSHQIHGDINMTHGWLMMIAGNTLYCHILPNVSMNWESSFSPPISYEVRNILYLVGQATCFCQGQSTWAWWVDRVDRWFLQWTPPGTHVLRLKAIYHCVKPPFPSSSWTWTAGGKRWKDGSVFLCQLPGGFRVYHLVAPQESPDKLQDVVNLLRSSQNSQVRLRGRGKLRAGRGMWDLECLQGRFSAWCGMGIVMDQS